MKKSPSFKSFVTSTVSNRSSMMDAMDSDSIRIREDIISILESPEILEPESIEKLNVLIETCQKLTEMSSSNQQEWLTRVLIKMKFRLSNLLTSNNHNELVTKSDDTQICGHTFIPHILSHRSFCDQCTETIWTYQKSYTCSKCFFNIHTSCLKTLTRVCVALIVVEKGLPELE